MTEIGISRAEAWEAVCRRDESSDGRFVYAVSTTRIYCRPSCPSRRPRRDRVRFYDGPDGAEADGYRACRRCHPRSAGPRAALRAQIERARAYLDDHRGESITLARLAKVVNLSPYHLQRVFKAQLGVTPREYSARLRLADVKHSLKRGVDVTTASYSAGYGSTSRAYEDVRRGVGMSPSAYRAGGRGETIRYTFATTPYGRLMLAATARGICAVRFGDDDTALSRELRAEFPHAELVRDDDALYEWREHVAAAVAGEGAPQVPLDVRATPFQQQVYAALRDIPRGETRSYSDVARAIGRPEAVRAVARACATNPVAVLVPCHRVVRRDGSIAGYRWGSERKERLLAAERRR